MLTGRGDGRFDVSWSGAAGENPVDLAISDLDEDGIADLAVANHETDYVTLLFGIAGGGFERRDHSRFCVNISPHPHAPNESTADDTGIPRRNWPSTPLNRSAPTHALHQGAAHATPEGYAAEGDVKGCSRGPIVDGGGPHRTQSGVVAQPRRLTSHRYQEAAPHSSRASSYADRWRSSG